MSITAIFRRTKGQTAQRQKNTADLYDKTAVASEVVTISRAESFFVELRLSGGTNSTGTVTLTGTDVASAPLVVVITVAGDGRYLANDQGQEFLTITAIDTANLVDEAAIPRIRVRAITESGQPLPAITNFQTFPVYSSRPRLGELLQAVNVPINSVIFFAPPIAYVEENDFLVVSGKTWEVKALITYHDRDGLVGYHQIIAFAPGQN